MRVKSFLCVVLAAMTIAACHPSDRTPRVASDGTIAIIAVLQCNQVRGLVTVNEDAKLTGYQPSEVHDVMKKYTGKDGDALPDSQTMALMIPCAPPEGAAPAEPTSSHGPTISTKLESN
jgi:hypothetical protein